MIESAAAQWKPRNGPEAAADFFSSQPNKSLAPHEKQPPEGPLRTDGNKKMMADKRQSNSESPMKASFFPKSKIQQATRRRHHIKHLSSPNRPIENKEK